jgi:hypothetical protein
MIKKLLPVILALVGTGAGVGAGLMLMPEKTETASAVECVPTGDGMHHTAEEVPEPVDDGLPPEGREFVKMSNQFVVPIMSSERVTGLVVASLSIEINSGGTELVYAREPKLRDVFLQVMFDHANIGGFDGAFTAGERMDILRSALLDAARSVLGKDVSEVLITEIARQDA